MSTTYRDGQRGQVLALFGIGLAAMVAMVALVVDGGNAFAQERHTQNGTDASALAGATVLAERLGGQARSDNDVLAAVTASATAMDVIVDQAIYTNIDGNPIGATVGANGGASPPAGASGVLVTGRRPFGTYFARAIGLNEMTAVTDAVAVSGWSDGPNTGLFPVTPPVNIVECDGQGRPVDSGIGWDAGVLYKIPLCRQAPGQGSSGSVGWIDWTPPAGGSSELVACVGSPDTQLPEECDVPIYLPSWNYVYQTGNTNAQQVESAMREWDGHLVYIPLFDDTCREDPDPGATYSEVRCLDGVSSGNGQNAWYHFPEVGVFRLCDGPLSTSPVGGSACLDHGAYISGGNNTPAECDDPGGNGAVGCLVGWFTSVLGPTQVVGPLSDDQEDETSFIGVQLIG